MKNISYLICHLFLLVTVVGCSESEDILDGEKYFHSVPQEIPVLPIINEASGIADSKAIPGHLWVQEDSGNPAQLYLLGHNGRTLKKVVIKGATNRDWEDIALEGNQMYIADIGDNNESASTYTIYRFPEPSPAIDTVKSISTIRFRYPDGAHDAEAFLIDPTTKDILLISKRNNPSRIYKLAYPYSETAVNVAELVGSLPYTAVVSAALSTNGTEAIIKTYTGLYNYRRKAGESLEQRLLKEYKVLPYKFEPQGEAVTFAAADSGFFTLSEKGLTSSVNLYFYKRE